MPSVEPKTIVSVSRLLMAEATTVETMEAITATMEATTAVTMEAMEVTAATMVRTKDRVKANRVKANRVKANRVRDSKAVDEADLDVPSSQPASLPPRLGHAER